MISHGTALNSVTAARNLLGQEQRFHTSISIQATAVSVDKNNVLIYTTLGLGAIVSALKDAAMFYTHTNGYFSRSQRTLARQALTFIQGTGLEIAIRAYGLDYDAEEIRLNFYRTFHVKINQ